jgi:hypothetical protein
VTSYPAAEWLEVAQGRRAATWELWARPIETADCLTEKGRRTAQWAVGLTEQFLGDDWLGKALGGPIGSWMWAPWNDTPHTFRRLIELGARIATVQWGPGWRALRKLARKSPDWEHVLLQLEVGGFAARDGWEAELEPQLPTEKRADLRLTRDGRSFLVETTTLGMSEKSQDVSCYSNKLMEALHRIAFSNGLSITGKIHSVVPDDELRRWLGDVASSAARMRGSPLAVRLDVPRGGYIELSGRRITSDQGLSGPIEVGNEGPRLVRMLRRKARQVMGSELAWLRVDEGGAVWHLTAASTWTDRRAMHEGLARIVLSVVDQFPHVAGVVLSESPMMGITGRTLDRWTLCDGRAMGFRQPLPDGSSREAIFVCGMNAEAPEQFGSWLQWYQAEPTWLGWALDRHGQATLDQIFTLGSSPA